MPTIAIQTCAAMAMITIWHHRRLLAFRAFRYSILPIWSTGLSLVRHWKTITQCCHNIGELTWIIATRYSMAIMCGHRRSVTTMVGIISIGVILTKVYSWLKPRIRVANGLSRCLSRKARDWSTAVHFGMMTDALISLMVAPVHGPEWRACFSLHLCRQTAHMWQGRRALSTMDMRTNRR